MNRVNMLYVFWIEIIKARQFIRLGRKCLVWKFFKFFDGAVNNHSKNHSLNSIVHILLICIIT